MEQESAHVSRRSVLTGVPGLAAAFAGCSVVGRNRESSVFVLAAGSLQFSLTEGLEAVVDVPLEIESHGSVTVARMIAEEQHDPDIIAIADPSLFKTVLTVPWHASFATNELVVAYNHRSEGGRQVARADRWFEPLVNGETILGRTDPDLDPLGYRTLFLLRLAADYYDRPRLADDILHNDQIYPETALLSHFETGSLDAAIVYRNMAIERDYEFVEVPDQINLSHPAFVGEWYSTVSYSLPEGQTVSGDLISYGSTIYGDHLNDSTRTVFQSLVQGEYLEEYGFSAPSSYPSFTGNVPDQLRQ